MEGVRRLKFTKLTKLWVAKRLPLRPKAANKGTFGKVLVVAGSKQYPGAAYLACSACYRAGAGLVTLATEPSVKIIVSRKLPEVTFLSLDKVIQKISDFDVLLIGPGLGQSEQVIKSVEKICFDYSNNRKKMIIDGDGLNILSKMGKWWEKVDGETILAPHPGEMSRLTGLSVKKVQSDRINVAQYYAKKWAKTVVLKGANTIIASPTGEMLISPFANPALATAGTGDVLAGIIAGMLAQNVAPFDAACVGVFIHGSAGELIRKKIGNAGMLASDLLPFLPQIIKDLA